MTTCIIWVKQFHSTKLESLLQCWAEMVNANTFMAHLLM